MVTAEELLIEVEELMTETEERLTKIISSIDESINAYNEHMYTTKSRRDVGTCKTRIAELKSLKVRLEGYKVVKEV